MKTDFSIYVRSVYLGITFLLVSGCTTVTLVQPYDAVLYNNTELFYKKASELIARGVADSPRTNDERKKMSKDTGDQSAGHYNAFKDQYGALVIDVNLLILRALANSSKIDAKAQGIHIKLEEYISKGMSEECKELHKGFIDVSLTVRNYIDLKCLIEKWDREHQSDEITRSTMILKKANWEGRSKNLFGAILAIQNAEASKKTD